MKTKAREQGKRGGIRQKYETEPVKSFYLRGKNKIYKCYCEGALRGRLRQEKQNEVLFSVITV